MTALEYELMCAIGSAIDLVADFSDEMDDFACDISDKKNYIRANELAYDVLELNDVLANVFNSTVENNKEEWRSFLKAESDIIYKKHINKKERRIQDGTV